MTPEDAQLRGFLYGIGGTIFASVLATAFQILLQWKQQKWTLIAEKKKMFTAKRLSALQGAVQLCDFLESVRHTQKLGPETQANWSGIERESTAHGALLPKSVQPEFRAVLHGMAWQPQREDDPSQPPSIPSTERLRELCAEAIQNEFETV